MIINGKLDCGGLIPLKDTDPSGNNSKIFEFEQGPPTDSCKKETDDSDEKNTNCIDQCVKRRIGGDKQYPPEYHLVYYNCRTYANDVVSTCIENCKNMSSKR